MTIIDCREALGARERKKHFHQPEVMWICPVKGGPACWSYESPFSCRCKFDESEEEKEEIEESMTILGSCGRSHGILKKVKDSKKKRWLAPPKLRFAL